MKIYMTDIVPFGDEKIFAQMLPFITEDRKNKIMQLKKKEDRCRSLAAGLLLEYGLREYGISLLPGKMQQMYLRFGERGKPVLNGKTGIHFNLSHSGRYVAGVFSDEEVGIDVEQIRKGQMKVAERFFCPEEYLALQKGKMKKADCYFTELWTRKESYIKAVGKGMALDFASFCVLQDQVKFLKAGQTGEWYLQSYDPASGYILSVCAKKCTKCEIQWISKEMFTQKFI